MNKRNHILLLFCTILSICASSTPPDAFATVANAVILTKGGARFSYRDVTALSSLEQQAKRVMGANPAEPLNITELRDASDDLLLKMLLLATIGNYTTAAAARGLLTCSIVMDPSSGLFSELNTASTSPIALKVVLVLLVAVQVRQWATGGVGVMKKKTIEGGG